MKTVPVKSAEAKDLVYDVKLLGQATQYRKVKMQLCKIMIRIYSVRDSNLNLGSCEDVGALYNGMK